MQSENKTATAVEAGRYVKRPIPVSAIQWDGSEEVLLIITQWVGVSGLTLESGEIVNYDRENEKIYLPTLEGPHAGSMGDYIIRGIKGECYPCRKDIFEESYDSLTMMDVPSELLQSKTQNLNFGEVIEALRSGHHATRTGWNGKGMQIFFIEGRTLDGDEFREWPNNANAAYKTEAEVVISPHIDLKAADGTYVTGWKPSNLDMLAADWQIVY